VAWNTTDLIDSGLISFRVNPFLWTSNTASSQTRIVFNPAGMVSYLFTHWRGDLIYTFKFVASPFHKGRVRISYDPVNNNVQSATDIGSVLQNVVVDLGVEREVEVRIPYQQPTSWSYCTTSTSTDMMGTGNTSLAYQNGYDNGIISLKVLTTLTAPVGTAPVTVLAFVRGGENLEFANPRYIPTDYTAFALQGEEVNLGTTAGGDENVYRVNFGEKIVSLRPLLQRSNYADTIVTYPYTTGTYTNLFYWNLPRKPPFLGYDQYALTSAKGLIVSGSTFGFQYGRMTPWHWISRAFIGQRGSFHWHYNCVGDATPQQIAVTRNTQNIAHPSQTMTPYDDGTLGIRASAFRNALNTCGGTTITNGTTQTGLSFSLPNMSMFRFQSTNPNFINSPNTVATALDDGSTKEFQSVQIFATGSTTLQNPRIMRYFSVGTDYSLYFFLCVPQWVVLPSWPTPV
jgi:hypothetical protein